MVVDAEVVYRWRLMHQVNGRNANQKRTGKNLPAQQDPEDTVEHEEVAKECKSSRGLGDAGELKEPSSVQRTKLPVRAAEENGVLLVECPFSRMGLDSQPTPSDTMLSMPLLDGDCNLLCYA
ncbi:hypothetical protein Nepgr_007887 [Nepenthes gracilis]|uniref:Uncharacterized protein n=1 Tax=Nepenthes gracilis TaxID=150966 RepID=A0AAD3S8K5_NEPGR|nr:hypothetical protein Nepgr_007887 [Nepenthes gracilis]